MARCTQMRLPERGRWQKFRAQPNISGAGLLGVGAENARSVSLSHDADQTCQNAFTGVPPT